MSDPATIEPKADEKPAAAPAVEPAKEEPTKVADKSEAEVKAEKLAAQLAEAQAKLKKHEDAKLSEQERVAREIEEQKMEAAKLRTVNVFLKAGLSEDLAEAVISGKAEDIVAAIVKRDKAIQKSAAASAPIDPQQRPGASQPSDPIKASAERNKQLAQAMKLRGLRPTGT